MVGHHAPFIQDHVDVLQRQPPPGISDHLTELIQPHTAANHIA
jgi:hypothetical protein